MIRTENSGGELAENRKRLPVEMSPDELNELFAECLPKLRKSARKMFRNEEDSEDALQEALLLAFRKIHQFEGRSSFSTWVHTIVRNTSKAFYRRATAHPTVSTDGMNESEEGLTEERAFVDRKPTPEEAYGQLERSEIFQEATEELPRNYRPAVYLFYSKGIGEEATAKALGITLSALKAQLHRSRILLKYRIRKSCAAEVKNEWRRARPLMRRRGHQVRRYRSRERMAGVVTRREAGRTN
jgi:RNA polymerase sigma-70 factor (ECF subfamily)